MLAVRADRRNPPLNTRDRGGAWHVALAGDLESRYGEGASRVARDTETPTGSWRLGKS